MYMDMTAAVAAAAELEQQSVKLGWGGGRQRGGVFTC